jgi:hypothetical protein
MRREACYHALVMGHHAAIAVSAMNKNLVRCNFAGIQDDK